MMVQEARYNEPKLNRVSSRLTIALLLVYLLALCWILVFKLGVQFSYMDKRRVNLVPFREALFLNGNANLPEIILNVLIFVPLGIYVGILYERWNFGKKLFCFFMVSAIVEGLQYILAIGAFDSTDIVNNTLGGIIGLLLYKVIFKASNNKLKAHKFINIIAAIGTVVMVLLLALLKLNMLPIRYQ